VQGGGRGEGAENALHCTMVVLDAVADFLLGEKPPFFRPSISADLLPEREPLLGGEEGGDRGSSGEESNDCGCGAHQETGELGRRLKAAHASVGVLTCSLMWPKTVGLLGLHCCTPTGQHIHFGRREADCGGTMDVDSVSAGWPVENISWSSSPPPGRYTFWVESAGTHPRHFSSGRADYRCSNRAGPLPGPQAMVGIEMWKWVEVACLGATGR